MITKLLILFAMISFSLCYDNKTVLVYDYYPGEFCNLSDPWNQSQFGGAELPILNLILANTKWGRSAFAFKCIASWAEVLEAYGTANNRSTLYDDYCGTFDGWLVADDIYNKTMRESQPYHKLTFGAAINYPQPTWVFFNDFDFKIIICVFILPLILGTLFDFLDRKHSKIYYVSNYYGLVFFQPEFFGKKNGSIKIISWFLQLLSLVVLGLFTSMIQRSLYMMKTNGGYTIENNLQGVRVRPEGNFMPTVKRVTLANPVDTFHWWWYQLDLQTEMLNNPNQVYIAMKTFFDLIILQNCSIHYIGDVFTLYNVIHEGGKSKEDFLEMNAAILDTMEFRKDFVPSYNYSELVPIESLQCKPKSSKNFRYAFKHLHELWYIYLCGILLAIIIKFGETFKKKIKVSIWVIGPRQARFSILSSKIKRSFHQKIIWLSIYQYNFYYAAISEKMKKVRNFIKLSKPNFIEKLKKTRSKVVLDYVKKGKIIELRCIAKKFLVIFQEYKRKHSSVKIESIEKLLKSSGMAKNKYKKKSGTIKSRLRRHYIKIVQQSLKECFIRAVKALNLCEKDEFKNNLVIFNKKKFGFSSKPIIKMKNDSSQYEFDMRIHSNMKDLFFDKIISMLINNFPRSRKDLIKTRKHKDQLTRLLKHHYGNDLSKLNLRFLEAVKFILRKKRNKEKVLKRCVCPGPQRVPKFETHFNQKNSNQSVPIQMV